MVLTTNNIIIITLQLKIKQHQSITFKLFYVILTNYWKTQKQNKKSSNIKVNITIIIFYNFVFIFNENMLSSIDNQNYE